MLSEADMPDPDKNETHWHCEDCGVMAEVGFRCVHCGQTQAEHLKKVNEHMHGLAGKD